MSSELLLHARAAALGIAIVLVLGGCSTISSSTPVGSVDSVWDGPVLVSQAAVPEDIEYKVVGSVQAEARAGYARATSLYPRLADEARKLGANAVVNAKGGRRVTGFSWSAAYVSGIAVKVADPQELKGLPGTYH